MEGATDSELVGVAAHAVVVVVVGYAVVESSTKDEVPATADADLSHRSKDEELGIALVALRIEVPGVEVGSLIVLLLEALPRPETVVLDIEGKGTELPEYHTCVRLPADAPADTVVTAEEMIVIAIP